MNRENILLLGGRAPVALELSRLFTAAGYRVWHAESFPLPVSRFSFSCYRFVPIPSPVTDPGGFADSLENLLQKVKFRTVIPACEETFYLAKVSSRLEKYSELFIDTCSRLSILHHKYLFIKQAASFGFQVPESVQVSSQEAMAHIVQNNHRVVLKPVWSRFGVQAVILPKSETPLPTDCNKENPWVVQEYIPGIQWCSWSVFIRGKLAAHTSYLCRYKGVRVSAFFRERSNSNIENWVRQFGEKYGFHGQIGFDFIVTKDKAVIPINCNPRATSGVHNFSGDLRLASCFTRQSPDTAVIRPVSRKKYSLKMALLFYGPQKLKESGGLKEFMVMILTSRDVIFRVKDPLPALGQFVALLLFLYTAKKNKIPLPAATVDDIAFSDPHMLEEPPK